MKKSTLLSVALAALLQLSAVGQNNRVELAQRQLTESYPNFKPTDFQSLHVDAEHTSKPSGIHYMYFNQMVNGLRVKNSTLNAAFNSENELIQIVGAPIENLLGKSESPDASVTLDEALRSSMATLGIQGEISVETLGTNKYEVIIDAGNYTHRTNAELLYWKTGEDEVLLAWNFHIDLPDQTDWYDLLISAKTGEEIKRISWKVSCTHPEHQHKGKHAHSKLLGMKKAARTTLDGSSYNVFPFPVESPNHGGREIVTEPAFPLASPFGWHDTDGQPGHEFTITRGNNVYAYEDASDTDSPGASAEGGEELNFDFTLNLANNPSTYQDAAITNLFYANNMIHDQLYGIGFDEAAGNFQTNNYGNGGLDDDEVRAEAQDGEAFNNANMFTPQDGFNPRMQMFLWNTGNATGAFFIDAPASIAGNYESSPASTFGPAFPDEGLTGDLELVIDDDSPVNNGCSDYLPEVDMEGKVALVFRGGCQFVEKVERAENAGAIAVIIINNVIGEDPVTPGGGAGDEVGIPSMMISFALGQTMIETLEEEPVTVTLVNSDGTNLIDGSFDNGIIIHEYIHGLTNRLTGGAGNSGCLGGDEQMGEGWSDYYAAVMTMDLSVDNPVRRGIGTFAVDEPTNGVGIRPAPYDTSFAVNDYTYADLPSQGLSIPHGVGFVWGTMLWDMTWALIDDFGFDPDLVNGTAGNNIAIRLVTEALKLQACSPGFIDGRDAILLADELLYGGEHTCLIWRVFAKRGLGFSADQGSSASRADGTAAFDLPPICQEVFTPPTAAFSASEEVTCTGIVAFTDESEDVPQAWLWDFGDGNTSSDQNPIHIYQDAGDYTVTLTVSNTLGEDQVVATDLISYILPEDPETQDASGCAGELVSLSSTSTDGNPVRWLNEAGDQVGIGEDLEITIGSVNETYFAQSYAELPEIGFVGPEDNDFGTGGNHATTFVGAITIEVFEPVVIESALVYSGAVGSRTIRLYEGTETTGPSLQFVTVDVPFVGGDRIDLGFEITEPGIYTMGLNQADFYRNDSGADYPYELGDVASIIGGSAGPDFYYYFYDVEVSTLGCVSDLVEASVSVTGEANFSFLSNDLTVEFTDESPSATSWLWNFGDGNTSTEQNPVHTYETTGNFEVTLTVDDACSISQNVPIGVTSTNDADQNAGFTLFPNPAKDQVTLKNDDYLSESLYVRLFDSSGRELMGMSLISTNTEIPVDQLSAGVYFISVSDANSGNILYREKLTVVE
jgi:PKD repeat protein